MNYADRLEAAVASKRNPCLVGLDPHMDKLPSEFAAAHDSEATLEERAADVERFLLTIVELVAPLVPAVKPQSAFFEELGAPGAQVWERVIEASRAAGLLIIGDVKRGDIGSTSAAYARAFANPKNDAGRCDAITVNPYLGEEGVQPFVEACAKNGTGLYVLVRTSNPGSARIQLHGEPPLCELVADDVRRWGEGEGLIGECGYSSIGAVVGATRAEEMSRLRELMPRTPFLLPGYGAQGAGASDIVGGFVEGRSGALVNSSRGILFANSNERYAQLSWQDAVVAATKDMVSDIEGALGT